MQESADCAFGRNKKVVTRADLDTALQCDREDKDCLHFLQGGAVLDMDLADILGGGAGKPSQPCEEGAQ